MKNVLLIIALFTATLAVGQNFGEIKGSLKDQITNEPVPFANVWVNAGGQLIGGLSDIDGKFTVKPLVPGVYNLFVKEINHDTLIVEEVRVYPNEISFRNNLLLSKNTLGTVVIRGVMGEPLIKIDNPSLIRISGPDLVKRSDSRDQVAMIGSMIPGVTVAPGGKQLYFRGSRPQNIATFIDGVKIMGSEIPSVPRNAISSISVYTGGVPAKYGDVTGGVVIIETKTYMDFWNEKQMEDRRLASEKGL